MGLFQRLRHAPERVKLGLLASSFFEEAPVDIIELFYSSLGRPALAKGLGNIGAGSDGDIEAKMQVFLTGAKAGDAAYERVLRKIMCDAATEYAGAVEPIGLVRGVVAVFQEAQRRKYVLDDNFDPMAITKRVMAKAS